MAAPWSPLIPLQSEGTSLPSRKGPACLGLGNEYSAQLAGAGKREHPGAQYQEVDVVSSVFPS
jgi:hypothetical protein